MKNIVLFSDGTGNSAAKRQKTNVWRLYQALDLSGSKHGIREQIAYYDDGVGTSSFKPLALVGGAFGWGLKRNVIDLYTFLCRHYKKDDQIYCFGFSRGAFTIRVLTGLIADQGLVRAEKEIELRRLATGAFRAYREKYETALKLEVPIRRMRDWVPSKWANYTDEDPQKGIKIRFVGLWDTVDAYGLPIDELTRAWKWVFPLAIPSREPSPNIQRICHALALDDERHTFHPVLLNENGLSSQMQYTKDEKVSQVWFAGVHSNVGGGYPDDALAMVSLHWMMCEAAAEGLALKEDDCKKVEEMADARGKLYDSRHGLGGVYRYQPRKIDVLCSDLQNKKNQVVIERPKIHESVFERIKSGTGGYAPFTLPARYAVVTAQRAIVDPPCTKEATGFAEHPGQAEKRSNLQGKVWNLVWWRRLIYFVSVGLAFWLAAFPLIHPAISACKGSFCFLSSIVRGIRSLLPGFLDPWFLAYESHPDKFGGLAVALAFMLWVGGKLQKVARDKMRAMWKSIIENPGAPIGDDDRTPRGFLYSLRTHDLYQKLFKVIRGLVLPLAAGLVAVWLVLAGLSQGFFAMSSSAGFVCASTPEYKLSPGILKQGYFQSASLCWASGVELTEGKSYRITLGIYDDGSWMDGNVTTGIDGLGHEKVSPVMYLGLPFRRALGEPWFKPIARIGDQGSDEYPLDPVAYSIPGEPKPGEPKLELISEITARSTGELFLYVNDVVLPMPKVWQKFYRNNKGTARVMIQPIPLPEIVHPNGAGN